MKGFKQGAQTHPGLDTEGARMGFAKGGAVRKQPASPEFQMTTKEQKAGQTGESRKRSSNKNDEELGGKSTLMPGYKKGGKASIRDSKISKMMEKYGMTRKEASGYVDGTMTMKNGMLVNKKTGTARKVMKKATGGRTCAMKGGTVKKAMGGAIKGAIHKRHTAKGRGEGVKAKGRGAKAVGKGGKTGMHKGFKHSKSKG